MPAFAYGAATLLTRARMQVCLVRATSARETGWLVHGFHKMHVFQANKCLGPPGDSSPKNHFGVYVLSFMPTGQKWQPKAPIGNLQLASARARKCSLTPRGDDLGSTPAGAPAGSSLRWAVDTAWCSMVAGHYHGGSPTTPTVRVTSCCSTQLCF